MGKIDPLKNRLLEGRYAIVILGPTASGKTGTAVELNKILDIEVISSDSRQIYKYLTIGTAKPDAEELAGVKHHLVDFLTPDIEYSAGKFEKDAGRIAEDIYSRNNIPTSVGGSGLYIQAFCEGLFNEVAEKDISIRNKIEQRLNTGGIDPLYEELLSIDPQTAEKYPDKNHRRITRALEYYYTTGIPLSFAQNKFQNEKNINCIRFGIDIDREKLYEKINLRAEMMWQNGLIEETRNVLSMGYPESLNSLNTVGYKECIAYLKGDMSEEIALEKMQTNTRRYAKRQLTWFRRYDDITWLSGSAKEIAEKIVAHLKALMDEKKGLR